MYGFTEVRTDNERYIISSLINNFTNAPDKQWTALTINDKKEKELAYWDNSEFLKRVLIPNLFLYVNSKLTHEKFTKKLNLEDNDDIKPLISSKKEAKELLELFQWARKLKMI